MAHLTIKHAFRAKTVDDTRRLASAFAYVALALATANSEADCTPLIGVKARPGSGKSTFIEATIAKMLDGQPVLKNEKIAQDTRGRKIVLWRNYLSPEDGLQIRNFDSAITGPYLLKKTRISEMINEKAPLPDRTWPGVDFVEHPKKVPTEKLNCVVKIMREQSGARRFEINLPEDCPMPQECLDYLDNLAIN